MDSLEKIIKGCQQNKMKYQKMLYDKFADLMFGICMRYANTKEEAEDVFQDGFVKVFKYIGDYSFTGSFEGWIRKIFVNTAISHFRVNSKKYFQVEYENIEKYLPSVSFEEIKYTEEELLSIINELPESYRLVFNLYAVEGFKHKEIAQLFGIDENTSKTHLFRARQLLQSRLITLNKQKRIKVDDREE